MIKAIVFDLDNTLYDEHLYIQSGFKYVVSQILNGSQSAYDKLWSCYLSHLTDGKNDGSYNIFYSFLKESGIYSREKELEMVYLYRTHFPKIQLYEWVEPLFKHIKDKNIKIAIITNGRAIVQSNKLKALNVLKYTDKYLICDVLGEKQYKPFPVPYKIMLDWLKVKSENCLFIDDIQENVDTAKSLGMDTIKVICSDNLPDIIRGKI